MFSESVTDTGEGSTEFYDYEIKNNERALHRAYEWAERHYQTTFIAGEAKDCTATLSCTPAILDGRNVLEWEGFRHHMQNTKTYGYTYDYYDEMF